MTVIKLKNIGFCYGVTKSIDTAIKALTNPSTKKPIYILGNLVHNKIITQKLSQLGAIIVKESDISFFLNSNPSGTIITTAHGISDTTLKKINSLNVDIINTTCKLVQKTHNIINESLNNNYHLILLGEKKHKEVIGLTEGKNNIDIIKNEKEISLLPNDIDKYKLGFVTQTTVTTIDANNVFQSLQKKFPNITLLSSCCEATKKRQIELNEYLSKYANDNTSLFLVIGDSLSNNTNKLIETINNKVYNKAYLIENINDLNKINLNNYSTILLTSGTSAPNDIVEEIYDYLKTIGD